MTKIFLTYVAFTVACVVVIMTFITSTNYIQLAIATLLYPFLIIFAYKILPLKTLAVSKKPIAKIQLPVIPAEKKENTDVSDINKRAFLKLVGATGLSFFLISIFGRRVESLIFGQSVGPTPSSIGNYPETNSTVASPTDEYKISEIDDNIVGFYGFIKKEGGWFIMKQDANDGSFRYAKGESNFPENWKNRQNLKYDYFHNVFY